MKNLLLLILSIIIFSTCQETDTTTQSATEQVEVINKDSINRLEAFKDSMYLEQSLQKVLSIVQSNPEEIKDTFEITYEYQYFSNASPDWPETTTHTITTEFQFGHLVSKKRKHLFVKRSAVFGVFYNIYVVENNNPKLVFFHKYQEFPSYTTGDTIKDVNGDGLNDLLMYWYPASGCCTRFMCDIALCQSDTSDFTDIYPFINVEFSPKDKIIRGRSYGFTYDVYKYKWNGLQVDTLETVTDNFPNEPRILTKTTYLKHRRIETKLKELPREYRDLEFEGDNY